MITKLCRETACQATSPRPLRCWPLRMMADLTTGITTFLVVAFVLVLYGVLVSDAGIPALWLASIVPAVVLGLRNGYALTIFGIARVLAGVIGKRRPGHPLRWFATVLFVCCVDFISICLAPEHSQRRSAERIRIHQYGTNLRCGITIVIWQRGGCGGCGAVSEGTRAVADLARRRCPRLRLRRSRLPDRARDPPVLAAQQPSRATRSPPRAPAESS